jgi:hypothetical protein
MCAHDEVVQPSCMTIKTVRARKLHECCECSAAIAVGEQHEVVSGIWDGEARRYRTCATCVAWRSAYTAAQEDGPPAFGCLSESLHEHQAALEPVPGPW